MEAEQIDAALSAVVQLRAKFLASVADLAIPVIEANQLIQLPNVLVVEAAWLDAPELIKLNPKVIVLRPVFRAEDFNQSKCMTDTRLRAIDGLVGVMELAFSMTENVPIGLEQIVVGDAYCVTARNVPVELMPLLPGSLEELDADEQNLDLDNLMSDEVLSETETMALGKSLAEIENFGVAKTQVARERLAEQYFADNEDALQSIASIAYKAGVTFEFEVLPERAKRMRASGMSIKEIAKATGATVLKVEQALTR